jgi:hypothetical protein
MRPIYQDPLTGVSVGPVAILDYRGQHGPVSLAVIVGGTNTSKVQFTLDDVLAKDYNPATGNWFDVPGLDAVEVSMSKPLEHAATAVRLNCTAWTTGSCSLLIVHPVGTAA